MQMMQNKENHVIITGHQRANTTNSKLSITTVGNQRTIPMVTKPDHPLMMQNEENHVIITGH